MSQLNRILGNPVSDLASEHYPQQLIEDMTKLFRLPPGDLAAPWPLRDLRIEQAVTLMYALIMATKKDQMLGVAGQIGVGKGKTLLCMLLPKAFKAKRPILLAPSDVAAQTFAAEKEWGQEYDVCRSLNYKVPADLQKWKDGEGKYRLVLSYAALSRPESTRLLTELQPDLIMADEAQALSNPKAARTKRFFRYMRKAECRFCPFSGSLFGKELAEFAHLLGLSLLDLSPLPRADKAEVAIWDSVVSVKGEPDQLARDRMEAVISWAAQAKRDNPHIEFPLALGQSFKDQARSALGFRLKTTLGFVMSTTSSCDQPLHIHTRNFEMSEYVNECIGRVFTDFVMPDEELVESGDEVARSARQLSAGFYYRYVWPDGEPDEDWLEARRAWTSESNKWLSRHDRDGCDSQKLLSDAIEAGDIKSDRHVASAWQLWKREMHKPEPPRESVWVDYAAVIDAVKWAKEVGSGIIWYYHQTVGDALEDFGIPCIRKGRVDHLRKDYPIMALNIRVYHKGHELQAWTNQLIMEPPSGGKVWEQLLGREHRQGQKNAVHTWVQQHTWKVRDDLRAACRDARTIQYLTFQPQKLNIAEGDIVPLRQHAQEEK